MWMRQAPSFDAADASTTSYGTGLPKAGKGIGKGTHHLDPWISQQELMIGAVEHPLVICHGNLDSHVREHVDLKASNHHCGDFNELRERLHAQLCAPQLRSISDAPPGDSPRLSLALRA